MNDRRPDRTILLRLLGCGGVSAALYLLGVWAFPLLAYAAHTRLYDLVELTNGNTWGGLAYALVVLALFGLYWQAARLFRHSAEGEDTASKALLVAVVGFAALFALVLMWLYPINASDLFQYFFRSRVFVHYKGNPFADRPLQFPADPYLYIVGEWTDIGSPYGPTWELLASSAALLTRGRLIPNLLALKAISILFYGSSIGLVYGILKYLSPERRISGTLLFAWNPLILLEWVWHHKRGPVVASLETFFIYLILAPSYRMWYPA